MRDALTLHDLPAHHTYRLEIRVTRWRWATHTSAARCCELRGAAYELHARGETWRLVSNTRDSITTIDPAVASWADGWSLAYRKATGRANAWSAGTPCSPKPWRAAELIVLQRDLPDAEVCGLLPNRSLRAVRARRKRMIDRQEV